MSNNTQTSLFDFVEDPLDQVEPARRSGKISGEKCLNDIGQLNHVGNFTKDFSRILIESGDWISERAKLSWQIKGTSYDRIYLHLFSSKEDMTQLLPTPTTQEPTSPCELNENGRRKTKDGHDSHSLNLGRMAGMGMLPTPRTSDAEGGAAKNVQEENGSYFRTNKDGVRWGVKLKDVAESGLLPTPLTNDYKGSAGPSENWKGSSDLPAVMHTKLGLERGKTSYLNPLFVSEVMGFPIDWTLKPFKEK